MASKHETAIVSTITTSATSSSPSNNSTIKEGPMVLQDVVVSPEDVSQIPLTVVIRSLRRRLWQCLQREDAKAAMELYQYATRADWEKSLWDEVMQFTKHHHHHHHHHHPHQKKQHHDHYQNNNKPHDVSLEDAEYHIPLLPHFLSPSEFFTSDDVLHPNDPYAPGVEFDDVQLPKTLAVQSSTLPSLKDMPSTPSAAPQSPASSAATTTTTTTTTTSSPSSLSPTSSSSTTPSSTTPPSRRARRMERGMSLTNRSTTSSTTTTTAATTNTTGTSRTTRFAGWRSQSARGLGKFPTLQQQHHHHHHHHHDKDSVVQNGKSSNTAINKKKRPSRQFLGNIVMRNTSKVVVPGPYQLQPSTTLLHQVARLGHVDFARLLLRHTKCHANVCNSVGQTALHMAAGGWLRDQALAWTAAHNKQKPAPRSATKDADDGDDDFDHDYADDDAAWLEAESAGIGLPLVVLQREVTTRAVNNDNHANANHNNINNDNNRRHHHGWRSMKWLRRRSQNTATTTTTSSPTEDANNSNLDPSMNPTSSANGREEQRLEVVLSLLSWTGGQDASEYTSLHSVDARGRTALHYAAALGRERVCLEALLSWDAVRAVAGNTAVVGASTPTTTLTLVDDEGRTPCEWAAADGHAHLAAHLEARAVWHSDPYGTDDELLATTLWLQRQHQQSQQQTESEDDDVATIVRVSSSSSSGKPSAKSDATAAKQRRRRARQQLSPPFSWFETWDGAQVQEERKRRTKYAWQKMKGIASQKVESHRARAVLWAGTRIRGNSHSKSNQDARAAAAPAARTNTETHSMAKDSDDQLHQGKKRAAVPEYFSSVSESEETESSCEPLMLQSTSHDDDDDDCPWSPFAHMHQIHVEMFLSAFAWDVKNALAAFSHDGVKAFNEAQVPIPNIPSDSSSKQHVKTKKEGKMEDTCLICCEDFATNCPEWQTLGSCQHSFCSPCLGAYITDYAASKSGLCIPCPHHQCSSPLSPLEVAELSPNSDVFESLLTATNDNFVVAAKGLRFCPHPSCKSVVKFFPPGGHAKGMNEEEEAVLKLVGAVCTAVGANPFDKGESLTYEGVCDPHYYDCRSSVQPPRAHRFCFSCGDKVHWPVSCEKLVEWKEAVKEQVGDLDEANGIGASDYNEVAQKLWMKANTKPCPKCDSPIQKDDGCNHMTCMNPRCKHEFCWICAQDWKSHSTTTGGFYRCNRWVDQEEHEYYDTPPTTEEARTVPTNEDLGDPRRMQSTYGTAMHERRSYLKRSKKMARFLHHYERWNAHAESAALEERQANRASTRLKPVILAAVEFSGDQEFNFGGKGLSFVHSAFTELLECRSMLKHSYAFSFFRYGAIDARRYRYLKRLLAEKVAFETLQSELEMLTEQMSDVVARAHLRATQSQITFLTVTTADKRKEFGNLMIGSLIDSPKQGPETLADSEAYRLVAGRNVRIRRPGERTRVTGLAPDPPALASAGSSGHETPRDEVDRAEMEAALRLSLEEFIANGDHHADIATLAQGDDYDVADWACTACTFQNVHNDPLCSMCRTSRFQA